MIYHYEHRYPKEMKMVPGSKNRVQVNIKGEKREQCLHCGSLRSCEHDL
jgi:hypothetical protein